MKRLNLIKVGCGRSTRSFDSRNFLEVSFRLIARENGILGKFEVRAPRFLLPYKIQYFAFFSRYKSAAGGGLAIQTQ